MNLSTKGILRGWRGILNDIEPWNLSDFCPFFKLKAICLLTIVAYYHTRTALSCNRLLESSLKLFSQNIAWDKMRLRWR